MKIYVYAIWFPTSKRLNPYYIGVSDNLERRMSQHLDSKFQVGNALQKYDDWIIKKLHTCKTYEEAFRIEIEEIRNFNCVAPNGYNLTRGGDGGIHCKETIEKIRKANTGHKDSKETTKKRSEAMIGNQNAKGAKHPSLAKRNKSKESRERTIKRNKENNPMKNPVIVLKQLRTKLKDRITKAEQENS